jgi:hypothetical protein
MAGEATGLPDFGVYRCLSSVCVNQDPYTVNNSSESSYLTSGQTGPQRLSGSSWRSDCCCCGTMDSFSPNARCMKRLARPNAVRQSDIGRI